MGILTQHITVQPTPPHQVAPDREIPGEIEAVILKAMAKEADERYQSMAEVIADLTRVAEVLAPHLLTLPSGSISAQISSQMPAQGGTGMRQPAIDPPSGGSSPAMPLASVDSSSRGLRRPSIDSEPELEIARPKRRGLVVGLLVAVAGVAVAAVVMLGRGSADAPVVAITPPAATKPDAVTKADQVQKTDAEQKSAAPEAKPARPSAGDAPKDVVILVDSEPVGAQLLLDGSPIGDTPQNVILHGGKPETLVMRKTGYLDQAVVLDAGSAARRIVRLVRDHVKGPHVAKSAPVAAKTTTPDDDRAEHRADGQAPAAAARRGPAADDQLGPCPGSTHRQEARSV